MPISPMLYPLINGVRYDWSSVEITIGQAKFYGVKSLSYSNALAPGEVRGTGPQIIGRTTGVLSSEASIEIWREEYDDLLTLLTLINPTLGYMQVPFDIYAQYSNGTGRITSDFIKGARITKDDHSHAQGGDGLSVKCDLHVMYITINGKIPVGASIFLKG